MLTPKRRWSTSNADGAASLPEHPLYRRLNTERQGERRKGHREDHKRREADHGVPPRTGGRSGLNAWFLHAARGAFAWRLTIRKFSGGGLRRLIGAEAHLPASRRALKVSSSTAPWGGPGKLSLVGSQEPTTSQDTA